MIATRHFKSGSAANQGGSVAAHYAETARKYSENTRRFGLDAAKAQLIQSNQCVNTLSLVDRRRHLLVRNADRHASRPRLSTDIPLRTWICTV